MADLNKKPLKPTTGAGNSADKAGAKGQKIVKHSTDASSAPRNTSAVKPLSPRVSAEAKKSGTPASTVKPLTRTAPQHAAPQHVAPKKAAPQSAPVENPTPVAPLEQSTPKASEQPQEAKPFALRRAEQRNAERVAKNRELVAELEAERRAEQTKQAVSAMSFKEKKELEEKVVRNRKKQQLREKLNEKQRVKAAAAATVTMSPLSAKKKRALIVVTAVVLAIALTLSIILVSCNSNKLLETMIVGFNSSAYTETRPSDNKFVSPEDISAGDFSNEYKNRTKVGYSAEYIGNVARKVPTTTSDEGLISSGIIQEYPEFGKNAKYNQDQRVAVIAENNKLVSVNTRIGNNYQTDTFDKMDADGNLYLNGERTGKTLYKHTGAVGMYYGNVSDKERGIIKKLNYAPRANGTSYNVTGVYAPAGEVVKVEISEADMLATGGIEVLIGQALYNKKANNIWAARELNRMPVILNTMVINTKTATLDSSRGVYVGYVGSFFGGPIYIYNRNVKFSVTLSGGVRYAHYIHGYTTPEEYEENMKASAPYFDLEVRENGILHSGPRSSVGAANLAYDNIYNAAVLWEKISLVSTQRNKQGIVMIYDPFVAAGAAVAFPGQMSVNCPAGWMSGSLNVDSFVSGGAWGNMHEYNHNFQGFGCGADGEVTNNSLNLVEYSLFTYISSARQIGNYGGAGLSGWNQYTVPSWTLNRVLSGEIKDTNGLAVYATLLHNFGQEAFIKSSYGRDLQYFLNWGNTVHQNMWYYTTLIGNFATADYSSLLSSQADYPMFVPVSSVYQTGRSYNYDGQKRYISTAQPFTINAGEDFTIDLNKYTVEGGNYKSGSIVIPDGFTYRIKKIMLPQYGTVTSRGNNIFTYHPDGEHLSSGKMIVTLEIKHNSAAFNVDDVDLVLEFNQSYETNKNKLVRRTYTYADADNLPETSIAAYESGFQGASVEVSDNVNSSQNSNAEIKMSDPMPDNTYFMLEGKISIANTGKYRLALRGRWDCALYISINSNDAKDFVLAAKVLTTETHEKFYLNNPETYSDLELDAGDWIYFKAVLKSERKGNTNAFIGLGIGEFIPPQGVLDENGNLIGPDGNIIENPQETVTVASAGAYRSTYEYIPREFSSDYFFLRDYTYTYSDENVTYFTDGQSVADTNFKPWDNKYIVDHLFDGDPSTTAHTAKQVNGQNVISPDEPLILSVNLNKPVTANCFEVFVRNDSNNKIGLPVDFKLEFRDSATGYVKATKHFTNATHPSGANLEVTFGEYITFGYYTLTVTKTENGYFAASAIGFAARRILGVGTVMEADNDMFRYDGDWSTASGMYTFGHIYEGGENATVKFTFTGTAFAVFAYKGSYGGFEVLVDGKSVGSVSLFGNNDGSERVFLSDDLDKGKHTVEIRRTSGTINIDNFVLW